MATATPVDERSIDDPSSYPSDPDKFCDLVLKGGATSAVIYPRAVAELALQFRLKNIGGTSAGAIGAAAAAAAELSRRVGKSGGFATLAKIPEWASQNDRVRAFFEPQRETRPLLDIAVALTDRRQGGRFAALLAALRGFKTWALVGAIPGALLLLIAVAAAARAISGAALDGLGAITIAALAIAGLALLIAGGLLGLALGAYRRITHAIPRNYYGITTGLTDSSDAERPSLTPWLTAQLNTLAGIEDPCTPLTFGDLWMADPELKQRDFTAWSAEARNRAADPRLREVNLEMMTTCLTQGRPYRFPITRQSFYFRPTELESFFPREVVQWMGDHPRPWTNTRADDMARAAQCVPLPLPEHLPVIVATRMSLSVPPLVSAVPLYAIDFTLAPDHQQIERCWFSDGGITSNFPVHFFDGPIPRWPTFGINLRPLRPDHSLSDDEAQNVMMAQRNSDGSLESWMRFEGPPRKGQPVPVGPPVAGNLTGFFGAIIQTLQNWTDNLQILQPGYRDRVAHVSLAEFEGGLNLRMEAPLVRRIASRGQAAGSKLRTRFGSPAGDGTELTWDNHRWLRYRRTMASLESFLQQLCDAYEHPRPGDQPYRVIINRARETPPTSYPWARRAQRDFALKASDQLSMTADRWHQTGESFSPGAPSPENPIRLVPPQ